MIISLPTSCGISRQKHPGSTCTQTSFRTLAGRGSASSRWRVTNTHRRLLARTALILLFLTAGFWHLPAHADLDSQPEAIVPTNTLPPAAGTYLQWPPETTVKFNGSLNYQGTNYPAIFHLQEIEVGPFTNIVRTVAGNDLVLEFDAVMSTQVPYMELTQTILKNVALYNQIGHFRIRVLNGNTPTTNRLSLIMEALSWTYQAKSGGQYYDFIHVRNATNRISTGWIETTSLPDGQYVMQSDLLVYPEGILLPPPGTNPPFEMDYVPAEQPPVRLVLKGIARTLQVLHMSREDDATLHLWNTYLGPQYSYGLEYTTNGVSWDSYGQKTVYGDTVYWFDSLETWSDTDPSAPVKWFRLKARPR